MAKLDHHFMQEMKSKLDVELLGVVSIGESTPKELKDPAIRLLPGVKSVVVAGKEIDKEVVALLTPSKEAGEAEAGELIVPHGDYLNGQMNKAIYGLARLFRKDGYRSLPLPAKGCPTDQRTLTAVFSYKHAAQLAGLGMLGRHSLLVTQEYGPRVRLACLLTEAPIQASSSAKRKLCKKCDACIQACPAQALDVPKQGEAYSINKFACRTYRQTGVTCSVCMKACDEMSG